MTYELKVKLVNRGHGDFTVKLPPLPQKMAHEHDAIFHDGDRVIFGLMIYRQNGNVKVELFDPNIVDPVYTHEFKETSGEET